jgi:hypothetical protein
VRAVEECDFLAQTLRKVEEEEGEFLAQTLRKEREKEETSYRRHCGR